MQQQDCEKIGLIIPNVWPYFRVPVVGRMTRLPPTRGKRSHVCRAFGVQIENASQISITNPHDFPPLRGCMPRRAIAPAAKATPAIPREKLHHDAAPTVSTTCKPKRLKLLLQAWNPLPAQQTTEATGH